MLNKTFDCNNCIKGKVCKYKEVEIPEIISKIKDKIDNECCPPIIDFTVSCKECQKKTTYLTNKK